MKLCDALSPQVAGFRFETQHLVFLASPKHYFVKLAESLTSFARAVVVSVTALHAPQTAFADLSAFEVATLEGGVELLGHNAGLADACSNGGRLAIAHDLAERVAAKLHPGVLAGLSGARGAMAGTLKAKADAAYSAEMARGCRAPSGAAMASPLFDAVRQSLEQQLAD